jgi:hypothetical protein
MTFGGLWLLGCSATVQGQVTSGDGTPVAGAVLHAEGIDEDCSAVTDADGRFVTRCAQGDWTFEVRHPDHVGRRWEVPVASGGEVDVGVARIERIPMEPGAFRLAEGGFASLGRQALLRTKTETTQDFCVDREGDSPIRFGDDDAIVINGAASWRLYALDAEGCAYRLARGTSDHWNLTATRVEVPLAAASDDRPDLGAGRGWLDVKAVAAGNYALVEWYGDFLVREDVTKDSWRGAWVAID